MNKVLIRARQIDNNRQLPILIRENDDLSDFNEYSNISRSSQILSGMDKGEESELHLQEVLRELQYEKTTANTAIPIPEVHDEKSDYDILYRTDFICPKNYIRLKTLEFEDECPEYDLDEDDQEWLDNSKLDVTPFQFEKIIEEFERACSQKALLLDEAKSLLRSEKVHIVIAVYDYWLTKRVRTGQPLSLSVKAEKAERCNNTPIDPYIAFRKRSEKMTTRKNRRVDESSYEKMYRLRQHMEKLSDTIEFVVQREVTKSHITEIEREIFIKRYESRYYDKLPPKESEISMKNHSIKLTDNFKSGQRSREENHKDVRRKRAHSRAFEEVSRGSCSLDPASLLVVEEEEEVDFTFRPMSKCRYLAPKLCRIEHQDGRLLPPPSYNQSRHTILSPVPSPHVNTMLLKQLYTLYTRDIFCGLPVIAQTQTDPPLQPSSPLTASPLDHHHISSPSSPDLRIHCKQSPKYSPDTADTVHTHPGSRYSEIDCQDSDCTGTCTRHDPPPPRTPHKQPKSSPTSILSQHNGNLCTYQNTASNHNQKHSITESPPQIYEQKQSPTGIKDLINAHTNHQSLSGGNYSAKLSQVVGLSCLKSLTNKCLIPREDIDEIATFYSKSNGHNQNNYRNHSSNNNHIINNNVHFNNISHSYNHNHNHHHNSNKQRINNNNNINSSNNNNNKWIKQNNTTDNSLLRSTLLPIWKSEPHVMTSVNKMA